MLSARKDWLVIALFGLFIFLQYRLWFESDGIRDLMHLKADLAKQKEETGKLKKNNDVLVAQIQRLKKSDDSTEAHARNELGMIKKGETFYQLPQ